MNSISSQTDGSMFPYKKEGAVYDVLDIAQLDDALDCVSDAFTSREPIFKAFGITFEEFRRRMGPVLGGIIPQGLSVAALEPTTGKLMGCLISEEEGSDRPRVSNNVPPSFKPVIAFFGSAVALFKDIVTEQQSGLLHQFFEGIWEEYGGRNIGYNLIEALAIGNDS